MFIGRLLLGSIHLSLSVKSIISTRLDFYAHSQLGVSRSASVVIGYVAMQLELSYNDSMAFVKRLKYVSFE